MKKNLYRCVYPILSKCHFFYIYILSSFIHVQEECTGGWLAGVRGQTKKVASHCTNSNIKFDHKVYIFTALTGWAAEMQEKAGGTLKRIQSEVVSLMRHQGEWHVPALKSDFFFVTYVTLWSLHILHGVYKDVRCGKNQWTTKKKQLYCINFIFRR